MSALSWDAAHQMEAGVSKGVLYPMTNGVYEKGIPWVGLIAVTENPSGADNTDLFADNEKYASLRAAEKFGGSIEAFTYPDAWSACDGSAQMADGVFVGQQPRKAFGLCYRTEIGDETHPGMDKGYKLHLVYNSSVAPSQRQYQTINDNPDAITMSWDFDSTPAPVTGAKGTCLIVIDSTKADPDCLAALEALLYGTDPVEGTEGTDAQLPMPDVVISTMIPGD